VKKSHKTRRAKLYFLRDRKGKGARLKEICRKEKKTSSVKKKAPAVVAEEPAETTKSAKPKKAAKAKAATKAPKAEKAAKAPKAKAKATKKKDEK
jgi:hypothetical protein